MNLKALVITNPIKIIYEWVVRFSESRYPSLALFIFSFSEASFFPIPPDALLIPLCVGNYKKSFKFALICSIASVLGGIFGFFLGLELYELIGKKIIAIYHFEDEFQFVGNKYNENAFLAILVAGFTPIPYKVFTIAAGFFKINIITLIIASIISRSARFFLVATLIFIFGEKIKLFIEKYLNLLTIIFMILLIGGFLLIKYMK